MSFIVGNQHQQYQNINPNIHSGSIPSTGRSSYASGNFIPSNGADKAVEDTRMLVQQSSMGHKNGNNSGDDKVMIPAASYIDQPMLSAMQQMFNNTGNMKPMYHHQQNTSQQIYFS